jgi:hypothetical protein
MDNSCRFVQNTTEAKRHRDTGKKTEGKKVALSDGIFVSYRISIGSLAPREGSSP